MNDNSLILTNGQLESLADLVADRLAVTLGDQPAFLDRVTLASELGVHPNTVDRFVKTGTIPSFTVGTRRLFDMTDVAAALKAKDYRPQVSNN
jgi:excisionase family DNA binding protein